MPSRHPTAIYRLRLLRRPVLRQQDLAVLLGIGQAKVSEYEQGTVGERVTLLRAMEVAAVFGVSVEEVFYGVWQEAQRRVATRTCIPASDEAPAPRHAT